MGRCVREGPMFAKGSQGKIKAPSDSLTFSQRGRGTPECVPAFLMVPLLLVTGQGVFQ